MIFTKNDRATKEKERTLVLNRLSNLISKMARCENGMTATEYVIMVMMIAMAIVLAVGAFGISVNGLFDKVLAALKIAG